MIVSVDDNVFNLFPELEIFGLAIYNLNSTMLPSQPINTFYKPNQEEAEEVIKNWKEIYKLFPNDKKSRASINYLVKASNNNTLKYIHPLVDIYNQASLLSLAPFGGEDINIIKNGLKVSIAKGNEQFIPLGKNIIENPVTGEVVYLDFENRVVCRSLNWLESDLHKITTQTNNIIFVSERPIKLLPSSEVGINFILDSLKNFCSSYKSFVLNINKPEIII